MAFILEQSPTFSWPIVIRELVDGGRYRTHQFEAVFNRLPQDRMEEVQLAYHRIKTEVQRDELIDALPTREIASSLHVSVKTVDAHREHIKHKLRLADAAALRKYAIAWVQTRVSP